MAVAFGCLKGVYYVFPYFLYDVRESGYSSYGVPPICCSDLVFLSGSQSEKSCLTQKGKSCFFNIEDHLLG